MAESPSVLLLDDGELDTVHRMLQRLGADHVRRQGPEIGSRVDAPRDLLISAGRRTLGDMPRVVRSGGAPGPTWVCVHSQDFLPMRARLRKMGVHFLVQSALDQDSLRLFLLQLLRPVTEKRASLRLPLGGEVGYRHSGRSGTGKLVELSDDSCRILTSESFDEGAELSVLLPAALGGGEELELSGAVIRVADCESREGEPLYSAVVRCSGLAAEVGERLASISRGEQIGTRITPLAAKSPLAARTSLAAQTPLPAPAGAPPPDSSPSVPVAPVPTERRTQERRGYDRPVLLLELDADESEPIFGRDLSLDGVRISGCVGLELDARLTVALYGAPREEPIILPGVVVRILGDGEAALHFVEPTPDQRKQLEKLMSGLSMVDSLFDPDAQAGRVVVAELRGAVG